MKIHKLVLLITDYEVIDFPSTIEEMKDNFNEGFDVSIETIETRNLGAHNGDHPVLSEDKPTRDAELVRLFGEQVSTPEGTSAFIVEYRNYVNQIKFSTTRLEAALLGPPTPAPRVCRDSMRMVGLDDPMFASSFDAPVGPPFHMPDPYHIDTGDLVWLKHSHTIWQVAYAEGGWVYRLDAPDRVPLVDCVVHDKAMEKQRVWLLHRIASTEVTDKLYIAEHVEYARARIERDTGEKKI